MPTAIDPQIRSLLDRFAAELTGLLRSRAESALAQSFGGNGAALAARRKPGRPAKAAAAAPVAAASATPAAKPSGKRTRLSPAAVKAATDKVFAFIKANPNRRGEDIRATLKMDKNAYNAAIRNLNEAKKIKSKGDRRATTYSAA